MRLTVQLRRQLRVLAAVLVMAAAFPATAAAAPSFDSCAAYKGVSFTASAPAGLRTTGTHRIQWKAEFTLADTGEVVVDDSIVNQVTIDPAAPAYPNTVLIRLSRNTTLIGNGDPITVDAIQPGQAASLYVNVSWVKNDKFFTGPWRMSFRYETAPDVWSAYQYLPSGPDVSFCVETTKAIWRKAYGWS